VFVAPGIVPRILPQTSMRKINQGVEEKSDSGGGLGDGVRGKSDQAAEPSGDAVLAAIQDEPEDPEVASQAEALAGRLRKAMKGFGTNESELIAIVGSSSRQLLHYTYKSYNKQFSRDLLKDFKSECSFNFLASLVALITPSPSYDAQNLHRAMKVSVRSKLTGISTIPAPVCSLTLRSFLFSFSKGLGNKRDGNDRGVVHTKSQRNRAHKKCVQDYVQR